MIHTISTAVHTSGSVHCRRRYGDPEHAGFLFTYFGPPSKYGGSPSFLRVTGRAAYRRKGLYETSMTTVRTWESVHRLRSNSWITFLTWRRLYASYSIDCDSRLVGLSEGYYSMETVLVMYFPVFLIYFVLACIYLSPLYHKFPPLLRVHRQGKREHPAQSFE